MTKKKIFTYIVLSLLLVYSLFISMIIGISGKENDRQREEMSKYVQSIASPEFSEEYNRKNKLDDYIFDGHITPFYNNNTNQYQPMIFMIFDIDKNIIASSGSFVDIDFYKDDEIYKKEYCNIDEFLTDNMRKEIFDFSESNNSLEISELNYNVENEKIIPIKIVLTNMENDLTLTFSNDSAEYSLYNCNYNETKLAHLSLTDFDQKNSDYRVQSNYKAYKEMREYAYSDSFRSVIDYEIENQKSYVNEENPKLQSISTSTGVGNISIDIDSMEIEGEQYSLAKLVSFNPVKDFFVSDYFSSVIQYTFIFALFATLVLIAVDKIYYKNEQLEKSRKAFANAAAHELKTPLAIISNQCECIMENVSPEKNMEYVNSIYDESKRMTRLVKTLIYYNKVSSTDIVEKKVCNLKELAQNELNKYQVLFDDKNISVETELQNSEIACNIELICLVIDNFLSNAVKYTDENRKVKISTGTKKNLTGLSVFNEGAKIDEEDGKHIWEELYRADKARTSNSDSTGMGLALSKKILELHGFTYNFKNHEDGVEFYFYKKI